MTQGWWHRLSRDIYIYAGAQDDPVVRARAVSLALPPGAVASGLTAAWMFGVTTTLTSASRPVLEFTVPAGAVTTPRRAGVRGREAALDSEDIEYVDGVAVTTPVRTVLDVARLRLTEWQRAENRRRIDRDTLLVECVVLADALLNQKRCSLEELHLGLARMRGRRGIRLAATVVDHAEPKAESPMETRMRMGIVLGDLPRPEAQLEVYNQWGELVAIGDLGYRKERLLLDFDGRAAHAGRFNRDRARLGNLRDLGWDLRMFTAPVVFRRPALVAAVRRALSARRRG